MKLLRLVPTSDGWALVRSDGTTVFEARGNRGRRRCLLFARTHDVPAVVS